MLLVPFERMLGYIAFLAPIACFAQARVMYASANEHQVRILRTTLVANHGAFDAFVTRLTLCNRHLLSGAQKPLKGKATVVTDHNEPITVSAYGTT